MASTVRRGTVVEYGIASRLRHLGQATVNVVIEIIFPPTCGGCGSLGGWFCDRCAADLVELDLAHLEAARRSDDVGFRPVARYLYADPVRRAIHLLKYQGQHARAIWFAEQLEPLLYQVALPGATLLPVPLTPKRERARGFNQSAEIVRHLSSVSDFPMGEGLRRIRDTRPQVELAREDRVSNVRGAFKADNRVVGRHVIVIDDVVTTGSTLRECADACLQAGAASVIGLAVASGK